MTALLQEAFAKASALPEDVQELLAKELLEEIEWEMRWDRTLADSQPLLDRLTARAMQEYREGRTEQKGFDEL
jgi:RNA 3'-terminal phosphate cyclase